jgi:hypothetical protein
MSDMVKSPKRPRDPNQLAKLVTELATTGGDDSPAEPANGSAAQLGRLGGLRGGKARAEKLAPEERQRIARAAAVARWKKAQKT